MNDEQKAFEVLAVKLLFKRLGEGRVVLNNERVPNLKNAIEAVRFRDGEPVMDTVEPRVRSLALRLAVGRLYASSDSTEVSLALCRSILESATNVRFLLLKNSQELFDKFVLCSLTPERRLFDEIQSSVQTRGGTILPIEQRMLDSI